MKRLKDRLERDRAAPPAGAAAAMAAVDYALGQWSALMRFVYDHEASIDNNIVARALRPAKLGLKDWLFVGHPRAGCRAAILYTLILNCANRSIGPAEYLADILRALPRCSSNPQAIRALQPKHWKQLQAPS